MSHDYLERLGSIAREMNQTTIVPGATVEYDLLADALIWSDEYPRNIAGRRGDFDCVKLILRFRTTVLLGKPDDFFKEYWDRARELFPNWAGFDPARLKPTDELIQFYERERIRGLRCVERLNRFCSLGTDADEVKSQGTIPETGSEGGDEKKDRQGAAGKEAEP